MQCCVFLVTAGVKRGRLPYIFWKCIFWKCIFKSVFSESIFSEGVFSKSVFSASVFFENVFSESTYIFRKCSFRKCIFRKWIIGRKLTWHADCVFVKCLASGWRICNACAYHSYICDSSIDFLIWIHFHRCCIGAKLLPNALLLCGLLVSPIVLPFHKSYKYRPFLFHLIFCSVFMKDFTFSSNSLKLIVSIFGRAGISLLFRFVAW